MKKAVLRIGLVLTLLLALPIHLGSTKVCTGSLTQKIGCAVDTGINIYSDGDRAPIITEEEM